MSSYCFLCARHFIYAQMYEAGANVLEWLGDCKIIQIEGSSVGTVKDVKLFFEEIGPTRIFGGLIMGSIHDEQTGEWAPKEYMPKIPRRLNADDLTVTEPSRIHGYFAHSSCWMILESLLLQRWKFPKQDDTADSRLQKYLYTLYKILDCSPAALNLHFAHRFYLTFPNRIIRSNRKEPREVILGKDPLKDGLCGFRDFIRRLESKSSEAMDQSNRDLLQHTRSSVSIPEFSPLPLEVVTLILSFLDESDVKALEAVESKRRIEVPDIVWKQMISSSQELGYLCLDRCKESNYHGSQDPIDQEDTLETKDKATQDETMEDTFFTWYRHMQLAKLYPQDDLLRNRQRVWKICKGLADQVRDIADATNTFLKPSFSFDKEKGISHDAEEALLREFHVQSPSLKSPLETETPTSGIWAEHSCRTPLSFVEYMIISYAGSGDYMRYVSGIQLFPSGDSIGYITAHRRRIEVKGKNLLSAAMSRFGLVDISLSRDCNSMEWLGGAEFPERYHDLLTFSRKCFRPSSLQYREMRISAKLDAAKLLSFTVESSEFLTLEEMTPREKTLQLSSWASNFPPESMELGYCSFNGSLHWNVQSANSAEQILFEDRVLVRVTCWAGCDEDYLGGITFSLLGKSGCNIEDLTIGRAEGLPIDFVIDGEHGEYLAGMDVYTWEKNGLMAGIRFQTNWRRSGIFTARTSNVPEGIYSTSMNVPNGNRIVGVYTYVELMEASSIPFIGVLSQPSGSSMAQNTNNDCTPQDFELCTAVDATESTPNSSQYSRPEEFHLLYRREPTSRSDNSLHHYASTVSLAYVSKITCFLRTNTGWFGERRSQNIQDAHIIGLLMEYASGDRISSDGARSRTRGAKLLGRVSGANEDLPEPFILDTDAGETITKICQHASVFGIHDGFSTIHGIQIHTSTGRSVTWGSISKANERKRLASSSEVVGVEVEAEDSLRFDYSDRGSILFIDKFGTDNLTENKPRCWYWPNSNLD